jgi:hypothetical protein
MVDICNVIMVLVWVYGVGAGECGMWCRFDGVSDDSCCLTYANLDLWWVCHYVGTSQ